MIKDGIITLTFNEIIRDMLQDNAYAMLADELEQRGVDFDDIHDFLCGFKDLDHATLKLLAGRKDLPSNEYGYISLDDYKRSYGFSSQMLDALEKDADPYPDKPKK